MNLCLLDHLCDDLEELCRIKLVDAAPYGQFNVCPIIAYCKTSIRRAARMQKSASTLNSILHERERKG